jgi:hypothetical protein
MLRRQTLSTLGVREWIGSRQWDPEAGMSRKRLSIAIYATEEFSDACCNETIKLASAAFESAAARETRPSDPRSCAWQFIKYYYAAYFAANALMRLCGHASTNLSVVDCTEINEQAALYGVGGTTDKNKFAPGVYYVQFDQASTPRVTLRLTNTKGGVHAQFWSGFRDFLAVLSQSLASASASSAERALADKELAALVSELQRAGSANGAWLSEMRNAVNYRFEHGTWFPYDGALTDHPALIEAFRHALRGGTSITDLATGVPEILRATRCCAFLLTWLRDSLNVMGTVARGRKKSLIEDGAMGFADRL